MFNNIKNYSMGEVMGSLLLAIIVVSLLEVCS